LSFFNTASGSSVKFTEQNVEFVGQVSGPVTTVQDTEFGSDKLKFWKDGTPAMKALVPLTSETGEAKTLHVPASSRLHKAIGAALGAAGVSDLEQGGVLGVTWIGFAAGKNPSNPPRDYSVRYITAADVAAQAA
jgi:hypothetical protein